MMKKAIICIAVFLLSSSLVLSREPKEYDSDVIYDESKIPHYDLPELLVTAEGKKVTTPEQWRNIRRPQILSLFSNLVYGSIPESQSPIKTQFKVLKTDSKFMGGKATRKDVRIRLSNDKGKVDMLVLVFVPNKANKPVPAFMKHSFNNTASRDFDVSASRRGRLRNGWPLGEFFDRDYAFVAVYQQDLVGHNEVEFLKGIHRLFYKKGQSFPKANEWGVLSAVAWGAMRAMDYLETDSDVDHTRVAIMGHSKMGKATLWTAAQDERFALAISAQSGCAGAALWRRRSGETLEKMVTRFPYWLCRNAWKFVNNEEDLPVDQHMLLACIAPRPVYVHSGVADTWADGRGEYLSAYHASEVYRLLGKKGLSSESSPPVGEAIIESDVGYHIRKGGHSIEMYDWQRFMDFADYHLKKKK
ncbi:MAG: acetylxylan esterase [Planctomycetes bacterium]|nr:acetylxylan esterase [Planctomycetota bacterium]